MTVQQILKIVGDFLISLLLFNFFWGVKAFKKFGGQILKFARLSIDTLCAPEH